MLVTKNMDAKPSQDVHYVMMLILGIVSRCLGMARHPRRACEAENETENVSCLD